MDIKYIREMVPHITDEIIEKQKSLQPGTCLGFGLGFKIPLIIKMEMPNPSPLSGNCDVVNIWCGGSTPKAEVPESIPVPTTPVSEPEIPKVVEPVQEKKEEEIEIMEPILPKEEPIEVMEPTTPKEEIIEIMDEPKEKEVEVMDEPTDSLEAMANNTPNLFSNSVIVPEKNTGDISDFISNGALQDIVETEPNGEIVSSADTMVEDVVNQIDDEEEKSSFDEDDGNKATSFFHMPPEETTEETPFTPVEADKIQPDFSSIAKLDDDPVDDGGSDSSNDLIALNLDGTAA